MFAFLRVAGVALALSTVSFAAGVAGDLSNPSASGASVVLRIPPELPADTIRAAPLPPLRTATAEARRPSRAGAVSPAPAFELQDEASFTTIGFALAAPPQKQRPALDEPKIDLDRAPKPETEVALGAALVAKGG